MRHAWLCLVLTTWACTASVKQVTDPNVFYKRDFKIKVNGIESEGVIVVPKASKYKMEGTTIGKLDLLTLTTCHREWTSEKLGNSFKYEYDPAPGLETEGGCVVSLGGYDSEKGRHSWGLIDFETDETSLPALIRCNGEAKETRGVSICQSAEGLIQEISFSVEVRVSPPIEGRCQIEMPKSGKVFRYQIPARECVFAFMETQSPYRVHRHTTVGYEKILLKKD